MNTIDPDVPEELPPTEPVGEHVVEGEAAFAAECMALAQIVVKDDWKLGTPVITRSSKWGLVWRVDFKIASADFPPLINRIICFKTPAGAPMIGVEFGQNVPPLRPLK